MTAQRTIVLKPEEPLPLILWKGRCFKCGASFFRKRRMREDVHHHCSIQCSRLAATHRYRAKFQIENSEAID